MKRIFIKTKKENKMELAIEKVFCFHTYISYLVMFLVVPILLLLSVAIITFAVMLPVSLLFGWC